MTPNYNAVGDAGTSKGAYQWQPGNFEAAAKNAGLDPNDFSPENQDKVAYSEVKAYKDKGYDPGQIASLWNSSSPNNWQNHSGTTTINGQKISYDTPGYVKGVQKYYEQITGNGSSTSADTAGSDSNQSSDDNSTSTNPNSQGFITSSGISPASSTSTNTGVLGTNPKDSLYGKVLNNSVTKGIEGVGNFLTGGGAGELGNEVGTSLATIGDKVKGLLGGQDNSQYLPQVNPGNAIGGGLKSIVGAGTTALGTSSGQGLLGISRAGSALESEPVISELTNYATKTKSAVSDLSAAEKVNVLTEALSKAEAGTKLIFTKALQELAPQVMKEAGVGSFSELNPTMAKALGLGGKAFKSLLEIAGGISLASGGKKLIKGLLGQ